MTSDVFNAIAERSPRSGTCRGGGGSPVSAVKPGGRGSSASAAIARRLRALVRPSGFRGCWVCE